MIECTKRISHCGRENAGKCTSNDCIFDGGVLCPVGHGTRCSLQESSDGTENLVPERAPSSSAASILFVSLVSVCARSRDRKDVQGWKRANLGVVFFRPLTHMQEFEIEN